MKIEKIVNKLIVKLLGVINYITHKEKRSKLLSPFSVFLDI